MNRKFYSLLTLVVALVLVAGMVAALAACQPQAPPQDVLATASYNVPVHFELGGKKLVVANGGTLEVQSGGILKSNSITLTNQISASSAALTFDLVARGVTATNKFSGTSATLTGDLDARNITATGTISVVGILSATEVAARNITATGTISVVGILSATQVYVKNITATGTISAVGILSATEVYVKNITATGTISAAGAGTSYLGLLYNSWPVLVKTDTYSLTEMDRGAYVVNLGAGADITIALPAASLGLYYCVGVAATKAITVDVITDDAILGLTNAAHNRIANTGTVGDSVCLIAIDSTNWMPIGAARGTWADAD